MDRPDLAEAEKILVELEQILGSGDEELISCRTRLDLENLF
jgi:hypothetical protein